MLLGHKFRGAEVSCCYVSTQHCWWPKFNGQWTCCQVQCVSCTSDIHAVLMKSWQDWFESRWVSLFRCHDCLCIISTQTALLHTKHTDINWQNAVNIWNSTQHRDTHTPLTMKKMAYRERWRPVKNLTLISRVLGLGTQVLGLVA